MNIKKILERLENNALLSESKKTFNKDELTQIFIEKPGKGKPQKSKPDKNSTVEIIYTEKPEMENKPDSEDDEESTGSEKESTESEEDTKNSNYENSLENKPIDSHDIMNDWTDNAEAKEMAEKILKKAEESRARKGDSNSSAGTNPNSFIDKLRMAHKPKIDWAKELRKKLTTFKSQSAQSFSRLSKKPAEKYKEGEGVQKSKAYHQWLKDPRSHAPGQTMIFKGPYVKAPVSEMIFIVALDVSGSIPDATVSKVFAEMDKIASGFKSGISHAGVTLEGRVYFMPWDTDVLTVDEYKSGDWKKYASGKKYIPGGGGTTPSCIFDYLKKHFIFDKDKPSAGLLNLTKIPNEKGMSKDDLVIPVKNGESDPSASIAPFLLIATDGQFSGRVTENDLGILYKNNKDKILYLIIDGTDEGANPRNIIKYESYKI